MTLKQHLLFQNDHSESLTATLAAYYSYILEEQKLDHSNLKILSKGLPQPNIKLTNGFVLEGELICSRFIGNLLGIYYQQDVIDTAVVDYFLKLSNYELKTKEKLPSLIKELNSHLSMRTYFVGYKLSLADLSVWSALRSNNLWKKFLPQKKQYPYLIRWFNFISSLKCLKTLKSKDSSNKGVDAGPAFKIDKSNNDTVVTRFPPEPSGYLHVGHAKAALINEYYAKKFNGKVLMRFDDTNPSKEKDEYSQSIIEDLETLGIKFSGKVTHTSDYFDLLIDYGTKMLEKEFAYIDDTDVQTMREERLNCVESRNRNKSKEDNLTLWKEMIAGTSRGFECCMRAKIDMKSKNGCLRDPVLFRCNATPHHRTKKKYSVYPSYDFCCPIVDSIEGVTHAMRTSEYNDRNAQYFWILDKLQLRKPKIQDYSRVNFVYTTLSKRKLTWFVNEGYVTGWDDPRMPTVRGMLRRGLQVEALRTFMLGIGASKATNLMQYDKLWNINKKIIDKSSYRYTVVTSAPNHVLLELSDPQGKRGNSFYEFANLALHPKNKEMGTKTVLRSSTILIEVIDAQEISEGEEVTLMGWGNAIVDKIEKDEKGNILKMKGHLNLGGSVKTTKKKLTWVSKERDDVKLEEQKQNKDTDILNFNPIKITLVSFNYLITVPLLEGAIEDVVRNKDETWMEMEVLGEAAMRAIRAGQVIQINRRGFYKCDRAYVSEKMPMVLFSIPDGKAKGASVLA